jgi:hypothetical protein
LNGQEVRLLRHHEIDYHRATFTTLEEYTILDPDGSERKEGKRHVYAITAPPDLLQLVEEAGFHDIETYAGYEWRAAEPLNGPRMLIVAQRKN